ncbi:MAG TPA: nucleotidyltransferase domain-containing protein [Streptosporangiaceae bacterium]|nr:nucleotidyltransferase domain-containing protein [Streptosporangiaceae bacterium]
MPFRQHRTLEAIAKRLDALPEVLGALVVGSLAAGTADAASDVDLLVCAAPGEFAGAWARRDELHVTGALVAWDDGPRPGAQVAVHRWVTEDMVLVEALFAAEGSGVRLAEPWHVIAGDPEVTGSFVPRPPVDKAEFDSHAAHPVDRAFGELKRAMRTAGQVDSAGGRHSAA